MDRQLLIKNIEAVVSARAPSGNIPTNRPYIDRKLRKAHMLLAKLYMPADEEKAKQHVGEASWLLSAEIYAAATDRATKYVLLDQLDHISQNDQKENRRLQMVFGKLETLATQAGCSEYLTGYGLLLRLLDPSHESNLEPIMICGGK